MSCVNNSCFDPNCPFVLKIFWEDEGWCTVVSACNVQLFLFFFFFYCRVIANLVLLVSCNEFSLTSRCLHSESHSASKSESEKKKPFIYPPGPIRKVQSDVLKTEQEKKIHKGGREHQIVCNTNSLVSCCGANKPEVSVNSNIYL